MTLSCRQHKTLPLQMEKNVLRQAEELKNQKTSLRAGKGKRQVVTYVKVCHGCGLLFWQRINACLMGVRWGLAHGFRWGKFIF